jgi:hypothetical protein
MLPIPSNVLEEMHKLHRDGSLLCLVAVADANIYIARNVRDVVWNSITWVKSWFEIEGVTQDGSEYAPTIQIHFSNIGGYVEQIVRDNNMLRGMEAELYVINSKLLEDDEYIFYSKFQIKKPIVTRNIVTIVAGLDNPLMLAWPTWKMHDSICQYPNFPGDPRCPYVGALTTCNRTIVDCLERHGHANYFGAQMGIITAIQDDTGL